MRIYSFNDVIGNFSTVSVIKSSVRNGSFPKFTIMAGDSGTGKSTCAEIVSLALNCENPIDGSPCLRCSSCKINLAALQGKGNSTRVKKINMADSEIKKDIANIVTQIFKLEMSSGKSVFILEEVHSLNESSQTALLEEIDKLNDNIYVILCTTKPKKLLEELRNRSITFRFSKLKSSESKILLENLLNKIHIQLPNNVKDEILKHARGVPRIIVGLTDFITKNNCDYGTIIDFLGLIDPKIFYMLFKSINDVSSYVSYLNELILDYTIDDLVSNFKEYVMSLHFLSVGVSTFYTNTSKKDKDLALELGKSVLYKIQTLVHSTVIEQDCDFIFMMLKVRSLVLNDKKSKQSTGNSPVPSSMSATKNVASDSLRDSSLYVSPVETSANSAKKAYSINSNQQSNLTPLSLSKLKDYNK